MAIFAPENTSYPIQSVTDGTSNTISHVEGLVGCFNNLTIPWRQYISGVSVPSRAACSCTTPARTCRR